MPVSLDHPAAQERPSALELWRARSLMRDPSPQAAEPYRTVGERLLRLGEPLGAYDVIMEGLGRWPGDLRLQQLHALALARSGAPEEANRILRRLYEDGHTDGETLGLLARTHKDLWEMATDPAERKTELRLAHRFYDQAYRLSVREGEVDDAYYTGINAATTALLRGEEGKARRIAQQVRRLCLAELEHSGRRGNDTYWLQATLGEAALILGNWEEAGERYAQAAQVGRGHWGDLATTRRQARLLLTRPGVDRESIMRCFRIPRVVVFAGHMVDEPGRASPRFPAERIPAVRRAIRRQLDAHDVGIGFSSAACGSDILFLEALRERRGELHVVLPYNQEQFVVDSVQIIRGAHWRSRFDKLLASPTEVLTASPQRVARGSISYDYANSVLLGLAEMRARQLGVELLAMAVWDGKPGKGPGGTATIVERWLELGHPVVVIDPASPECPRTLTPSGRASRVQPQGGSDGPGEFDTRIMAILFADAVAYSKLAEEQIPRFVRDFLGGVAELADAPGHAPVFTNTWGDGLYFVFSEVRDAGRFALTLRDRVVQTDWGQYGLPKELNLRIALHAGPVYSYTDPLTRQSNYGGTHVSRAARIEPITPQGRVYASQAFAALASAYGATEFTCDYVGQTALAKEYGIFPTYHVHWRRP